MFYLQKVTEISELIKKSYDKYGFLTTAKIESYRSKKKISVVKSWEAYQADRNRKAACKTLQCDECHPITSDSSTNKDITPASSYTENGKES